MPVAGLKVWLSICSFHWLIRRSVARSSSSWKPLPSEEPAENSKMRSASSRSSQHNLLQHPVHPIPIIRRRDQMGLLAHGGRGVAHGYGQAGDGEHAKVVGAVAD